MAERVLCDQRSGGWRASSATSVAMLRAVLDGATYEAVAAQYHITRTAVERRIKIVAKRLVASTGIAGVNEDAVTFVRRLRQHQPAVLEALDGFGLAPHVPPRRVPILSEQQILAGAARIQRLSASPLEDLALYYMLLATGARPLEIARLEVRDYLEADGQVRRQSELRAEAAITGKSRPLCFRSARLDQAMDAYLAARRRDGEAPSYRGLAPQSRLFQSPSGQGFEITPYGRPGQRRFHCRAVLEAYRKLLRHAGFQRLRAGDVRHTLADRVYARGGDEAHVGLLLGISDLSAVRELFPRRVPTLDDVTTELV